MVQLVAVLSSEHQLHNMIPDLNPWAGRTHFPHSSFWGWHLKGLQVPDLAWDDYVEGGGVPPVLFQFRCPSTLNPTVLT